MNRKLKILSKITITAFILLLIAGYPQSLEAASRSITPKLSIKYNYNNNVDAIDEDRTDVDRDGEKDNPTEHTWIDYMLGLEAKAVQSNTEEGIEASLGYSQYLDSQGDLENVADIKANEYSFLRAKGKAWFKYTGRRVSVDLIDDLYRTRNLQDLYGPEVSAISERYLYTDNTTSLQLRFQPSSKTRALLRGSYETLVFDEPENDYYKYAEPAGSTETKGHARFEYDFSSKTTGAIDLQGGQRIFGEYEIPTNFVDIAVDGETVQMPTDSIDNETSDYTYYMGLLSVKYRFNDRSSLSASAGAHVKDFFDQGPDLDLQDYTAPVARINFIQLEANRYRLGLMGEVGTSTYGMDLFFNYYQGSAKFRYYFVRYIFLDVYGTYKQDTYDLEINDREWLWDSDRVDNLLYYGANIHWNILQKNDNTWLALEILYNHRTRDSSIVEQEDYAFGYGGPYVSYNANIEYYGVQLQFMPMILIGNRL